MKKMSTTVLTVAVLAVPVGIIAACGDSNEPVDPSPASVDSDQIRDRHRLDQEP